MYSVQESQQETEQNKMILKGHKADYRSLEEELERRFVCVISVVYSVQEQTRDRTEQNDT